ncbi:hypothetical protein DW991_19435, partial [Bacteroides thetaiotaomicron]
TYGFNKTIAADTIRFIVTVAIVVYKGLIPVVGRILTKYILFGNLQTKVEFFALLLFVDLI